MSFNRKTRAAAVILAAGQGKRMNSATAKQYLLLDGKPVLCYSLRAFQDSSVEDVILVTGAGEEEYVRREIVEKYGFDKVRRIVEGGRERYHSVYNGLQAVRRLGDKEKCISFCLIHDGARPFVTVEIIERTLSGAVREGACVAGMPAKDTIKLLDGQGYAASTPPRGLVWTVQTPQTFELSLILKAYDALICRERELLEQGCQITDDAGVVELLTDSKVKLAEGSYENIKITTPEDLCVAEAFLKNRRGSAEL